MRASELAEKEIAERAAPGLIARRPISYPSTSHRTRSAVGNAFPAEQRLHCRVVYACQRTTPALPSPTSCAPSPAPALNPTPTQPQASIDRSI